MIRYFTKHLIIRYIISGGISAFFNLSTLSILYYVFHVYYILASIIAFVLAFFVSMSLQKFWTFKDNCKTDIHLQIGKYLAVSLFGLAINTFLLYLFVGHFHLYVIVGQIFASAITACITFFISRDYVFNQTKAHTEFKKNN